MQAIRLKRTVKKNGELHLTRLSVVQGQQVELLLLVDQKTEPQRKKKLTARSLLASGLNGMWKDRADLGDSSEYARQLREKAQRRQE